MCVVCGRLSESSRHLFLHYDFAATIWYVVCRWLEIVVVLPADVLMSYSEMVGSCRNKRIRKGFSIICLALVWVIWKIRNERAFNNIVGPVVAKALDQIQRLSWLWYLSKMANDSCLLYIWMGLEPGRAYGEGMKINFEASALGVWFLPAVLFLPVILL
jgi:hypothetical protein